jgi:tRNA1(Val) A37 N6-methylase TrmN6
MMKELADLRGQLSPRIDDPGSGCGAIGLVAAITLDLLATAPAVIVQEAVHS